MLPERSTAIMMSSGVGAAGGLAIAARTSVARL
jgi:hypothetical protein